ncbi:cystatin-like [Scyliorhinus canicula]|uniref:cystatin-like n=1 Tax=Scyliorhinus canicula TaxID=7830 RepID=UPI0018F7042E|nr:cystatin-like [Scyliorhinus canicula]
MAMMGARGAVAVVLLASLAICSNLLGAPEPVSLDSPEVQSAAQFAIAEYNKASNDMFASKIVRIISARHQLVSGTKYILQVEVARTQCRLEHVVVLQICELHESPQTKICNFDVLSIPWDEEITLLKSECAQSKK